MPSTMSTRQRKLSEVASPKGGDEDDIGALIYRERQLRKREAAAAKKSSKSSSKRRRATSTRSSVVAAAIHNNDLSPVTSLERKSSVNMKRRSCAEDDGGKEAVHKVARKRRKCEFSADGCANIAVKGGLCVRHGQTMQY